MDNIRKQLERLRPLRVRADRIDVSNTVVLTYGDVLETAVAHFRCCAPALPDFLLVDWGGEASEWTAAAERLQAHIFPVTELARAGRDIPHVFTRPIRERWLPGGFEPMAFLLHKKGISRYQVDSAVYSAIGQWRAPAPEFIEKRMYDVQTVYSALADHESREVFLRIMKCIATGDPGYLPMAAYSQYNHPLVKARRGDVVVEGGVESGYTTLAFAGQVGPQGRVYGFEILKRAADKARLVMKDHSWVSIENLGLWSGESSLFLAGSGAQTRISATPVTDGELCRTIDLDAFLGRHGESCDLLKLDIEGAETECLRGAAGTLDRHRPKLQVSLYHSLSDYLDIPLMLLQRDWGYRLYIGHHRPLYNETCLYAQPPDSFLRRKIPWKEVVTDRFTSLEVLRPVMDRINPACTAVVTFGNVLEDAVRHYAGFEPPLLRQPDFVLADWRKGEHPEWEEIARRLGVRVVRAAEALSLGTTHYCLYTRPNRHLGPVDGYWPLSKVAQKIGLEHAAVDAATVSLFYQPKHDPGYADKYMDAICEIYAALADDDSREIFLRVVKTIVTRDPGYLRMSPYEQYQHPLVHPELGDTMYEGGMSTGENTRIFSGQVGPKGKVYGFEPRQAAAQWVRTHLADCLNVHVEAQGLWSGTYTFHIEDNAGASRVIPVPTKRSTPCRCIDLDSYIANTAGGGGCVIFKLDI
jgi:FkbM family methyltransferase